MIIDKARYENVRGLLNSGYRITTQMIDLRGIPIEDGDLPLTNPFIRYTDFRYYITWCPKGNFRTNVPYLLHCDLFPTGKLRFKNIKFLQALVNGDIVDVSEYQINRIILKWLFENTNLSESLLNYARTVYQTPIYLAFDVIKYNEKLLVLKNKDTVKGSNDFEMAGKKIYFNACLDKELEVILREVKGVVDLGVDSGVYGPIEFK